ncbi:PREDICTED: multiple epidermal growth factor-like domains protein 10 isoform X5 [Bactrocera latifrons]|uniref:multiple epidermal growth factor-like domains protein 10 isoform X5 n=1 Tax=Bactrocera latifrons TaxID=174628 RepID=UPI0008DE798B|nr:PREDICTED: multiple epidermal growth factor-like domains protein 10 isoform X5 [Bactrocera latifrons]
MSAITVTYCKLFAQLFTLLSIINIVYSNDMLVSLSEGLDGPNVCKKRENYPVEVTTTELQSYQERQTVWCLNVPPRCSSYQIKHRTVNKTRTLMKTRIVRACCDGYTENPNGDGCIPKCTHDCEHGKCIAPEKCKCEQGWGGETCDLSVHCETNCPVGYYGENCDQVCRCLNNSSCDPDSGRCICAAGWTGVDCSEPCPHGFFGVGCKERCPDSAQNNTSCDHITGEIVCRPGYIGLTCKHPCPDGYYGPGCKNKCHCEHGGECNHVSGQCLCLPGWTGANCNISCPDEYYGPNCSQHCRCQNGGTCRKNDGFCVCPAGWMGTRCEEVCPEGFYGKHCITQCECPSQNFVCHIAVGCVCRKGYTGANCDRLLAEERIQEAQAGSNRSAVVWGSFIFLILCGIIMALVFYYRRRVSNLKTEIQHVQYISDPSQNWADRHNFDNPVYGFPEQQQQQRLLNDMRPKINNLGRSDLYNYNSNSSTGSAASYSGNFSHDMSAKNFTADLTNPNIYNSYEDPLKVEHVYDEIKQKEGYNNPVKVYCKQLFPEDEYDHLDYSRPSTSQKPHYHRMNDTTLNINHDEEKPSNLKAMSQLLEKPNAANGNALTAFEEAAEEEAASTSLAALTKQYLASAEDTTSDSICDNASTASPSSNTSQAI